LSKERLAVAAAAAGLAYLLYVDGARFLPKVFDASSTNRDGGLEADVRRARDLVDALAPAIRSNYEIIARGQREIEQLRDEIDAGAAELDVLGKRLIALRSRVPDAASVSSSGSAAGAVRVERGDLRRSFAAYLSQETLLNAKRELLRCRQADLAKARAAQDEALTRRRELSAAVTELELRTRRLRDQNISVAGDTPRRVEPDKLAQLEELLSDIRTRLFVAERVTTLSQHSPLRLSDAEVSDEQIERDVDRHFARPTLAGSVDVRSGQDVKRNVRSRGKEGAMK
jgi:hypothetical protein